MAAHRRARHRASKSLPTSPPMRQSLALAVAAILATTPLAAQTTSAAAPSCAGGYDACAVRAEVSFFRGTRLVRGTAGEPVARLRGFGGSNLATLLAGSDSAVAHARRYTRASRTSGAFGLVGAALFATAAAIDLEDREVKTSGLVLVGAGTVAGLAATGYQLAAQRSLGRAVWWYNRDVVAR